jgi:hypothetical protein
MVENPRLKRPQRITRRTKRRVWLPYGGPPLLELWVKAVVAADTALSTLQAMEPDPESGQVRYDMVGVERIEFRGGYGEPVYEERVPREAGKGIWIGELELRGIGIFQVEQLPGRVFCTDAVRRLVLEEQFTNVDFFEVGETF